MFPLKHVVTSKEPPTKANSIYTTCDYDYANIPIYTKYVNMHVTWYSSVKEVAGF